MLRVHFDTAYTIRKQEGKIVLCPNMSSFFNRKTVQLDYLDRVGILTERSNLKHCMASEEERGSDKSRRANEEPGTRKQSCIVARRLLPLHCCWPAVADLKNAMAFSFGKPVQHDEVNNSETVRNLKKTSSRRSHCQPFCTDVGVGRLRRPYAEHEDVGG